MVSGPFYSREVPERGTAAPTSDSLSLGSQAAQATAAFPRRAGTIYPLFEQTKQPLQSRADARVENNPLKPC